MDELAATTVAGLILGDGPANRTPGRPIDKPVTSQPSSTERREEVEARRSRSEVVSEGDLNPPSRRSAPRGSGRGCPVTCGSWIPAATVRARGRPGVPGAVRTQRGPSG
jgi:hypothetical protein